MEHLTGGKKQERSTAGRSIALGRGGEAVASSVELEMLPPHISPEKVFTGNNRVAYGLNLVAAAIQQYGLCSVDFYRQWDALTFSMAGAFGRSQEEAAVVLAYFSPLTHAGQNLIGAIADLTQRQLSRMDEETAKQWAKERGLNEDEIVALKRFIEQHKQQPLPAQMANIIGTNQETVDDYFTLLDEVRERFKNVETEEDLVGRLRDALNAAEQERVGRGKKKTPDVYTNEQAQAIINQYKEFLGKQGVEGNWWENPKALALLPVAIRKGDAFYRETKNEKVANFLWNILLGGQDRLPTMDTRMMEAFGLFEGLTVEAKEALRNALFRSDIYHIWASEAAEYFTELQEALKEKGVYLTIPEIQVAIWQTIRAYSDHKLIGKETNIPIPFTFAQLFPRTTLALLELGTTGQVRMQVGEVLSQKLDAVKQVGKPTIENNQPFSEEAKQKLTQALGKEVKTVEDAVVEANRLIAGLDDYKQQLQTLTKTASQLQAQGLLSGENYHLFAQYRLQALRSMNETVKTIKTIQEEVGKIKDAPKIKTPFAPEHSLPVGIAQLLDKIFGKTWRMKKTMWQSVPEVIRRLNRELTEGKLTEGNLTEGKLTEGTEVSPELKALLTWTPPDISKEFQAKDDAFKAQFTDEELDLDALKAAPYRTVKTTEGAKRAKELTKHAIVPQSESTPPLFKQPSEELTEKQREQEAQRQSALNAMRKIIQQVLEQAGQYLPEEPDMTAGKTTFLSEREKSINPFLR